MANKLTQHTPGLLSFHCPGCNYGHSFHVAHPDSPYPNHPKWEWNGSMAQPTFTPSLLVNGFDPSSRCHSFVTNGRIQFLSDCHHALAGQTVDLPRRPDRRPNLPRSPENPSRTPLKVTTNPLF